MFLAGVRRDLDKAIREGGEFCYASFLCCFFFERVPTLRPRVPVRAGLPSEPRMMRWGQMMPRAGGGVRGYFTEDFYQQWEQMPLVIEDYPYAGMDYRGDPEMPRAPGQAWSLDGMFCVLFDIISYVV
jgi:hypothetical protein